MNIRPFLITLSALAMSVPTLVHAADVDADGMDDAWETSMGLSPSNATDAFTDKDGDRIPNLWEYSRGTFADNAANFPAYDAVVTMNPVPSSSPPQFATLQEAYDSLTGPSGTYYLVEVKRGIYPSDLSQGAAALKVAWIAETGADRATGLEGVILSGGTLWYEPPTGLEFGDDTLVNGFIVDGTSSYPFAPAVRTIATNGTPRICLLNTIIRHWNPFFDSDSPYISGAILNDGAILRLLHCTVERSAATSPVSPYDLAVIENKAGSTSQLRILNSLVWSDPVESYAYQIVRGDVSKVWVTTSHLQGLSNSGFNTSQVPTAGNSANWPNISWGGYINSGSPAIAKTGGSAQGVMKDIQNQTRPTSSVAMGASQLVDTDADTLPDWWEQFWFGNLSKANTGVASISDPDADGVLNLNEFTYATAPTSDQDSDGLPDTWEIQQFGSIGAQTASGNPDNDARTNLQEYQAGTNPNAMDSDFDGDIDGLMDVWEIAHFDSIAAQCGSGNPDGDGRTNLQEQAANTNPNLMDSDWDGDSDGLMDVWEITNFDNTQNQSGADDPDNDGATNLEEQARDSNPVYCDTDWDMDGWVDLWEKMTFGNFSESPLTDLDGDGLSNGIELNTTMSSMFLADTNGDGFSDSFALMIGLNLTGSDTDGDGLDNSEEALKGTNPFLFDTDNDGLGDAVDPLPLDSNGDALVSAPGAPQIWLDAPVGALLVQ